jgi:hypothetical protein
MNGRKRHLVTDTAVLMVGAVVDQAGLQNRDRAPMVLRSIRKGWARGCAMSSPPLGDAMHRLPGKGWRLGRDEVAPRP